jgi:hypothetical protein
MANQATARFVRYHGGRTYFARVTLTVEPDDAVAVRFQCAGDGWVGQGYIEEVPAAGYDDWKAGAAAGIRFALRVAGAAGRVTVTKIEGLTTDTNPSVVGAAAALAVWECLRFSPDERTTAQMEGVVFTSGGRPDQVPDFGPGGSDPAGGEERPRPC